MRRQLWHASAVKILFAALVLAATPGLLIAADDRLSPAIGPPNVARYRSIRDARDWRNPILVVEDDGVSISANGASNPTHVAIEDVKRFLVRLPVSAWPYGRVVAQTDQHILPVPPDAYVRKMSKVRQQLATVLRDLRIRAE